MFEQRPNLIAFRALTLSACLALVTGCGGTGEQASAGITPPTQAATAQTPVVPTGLAATAGNALVNLTWSASSNATSYAVKRATISGGPYGDIGTATSTSYTDSTVVNGATYFYVVAAINSQGASTVSVQVSTTPLSTVTLPPAVPTSLAAIPGNARVTLYWSASSDATSFDVKRSNTNVGPFVQIATVMSPSYIDTAVSNGSAYYYVVDAANSVGASANSGQISATPSAPGNLTPVGEWKNITPTVPQPWANTSSFFYGWTSIDGAKADAPKTIYVMMDHGPYDQYSGIWKSTNGGDSWTYPNQGPNGELRQSGFLRVDPTNSDIVYVGLIKSGSGLFKTVDGGNNWSQLLPANYEHDIYGLAIDPYNHQHLLLTFHSCQVDWPLVSGGTNGAACGVLETLDGGSTWIVHYPGAGGWTTSSQFAFFVGERNDGSPDTSGSIWIVSNQNGQGIWRTENSGATWSKVANFDQTHGMQSLYRAANNALYMGSQSKIFRSLDNGRSWSDTGAQSSPDGYGGIVGDGAHIWAMLSNGAYAGPYRWQILSEADSTSSPTDSHWTFFGSTTYLDGPDHMIYDPVNKVLYSSQWGAGVFKLDVVP